MIIVTNVHPGAVPQANVAYSNNVALGAQLTWIALRDAARVGIVQTVLFVVMAST